ncbi:MAG TPA: hypothetical protein VFW33_12715 [Gemmataceae bacterium]|nr:hypothetical protein [Gemmataceae bacterium]
MVSRATRLGLCATAVLLLGAPGRLPTSEVAGAKDPVAKKDVTVTLKIADKTAGLSLEAKKTVAHDSNAFDAVRHLVAITYKTDPENGAVVTGMCGVTAPRGCFWAAYVDGTLCKTGLGRMSLTKDTTIEWRIERVGDK